MAVLAVAFSLVLATPGTSAAHRTNWNVTGASIYGGFCGDSGSYGYKEDYLPSHPWSFAELGMGHNLGGLAHEQRIRILYPPTHRKTWIEKLDIGGGGNSVEGHTRGIDLYAPVAAWIANASCTWTGTILWRK